MSTMLQWTIDHVYLVGFVVSGASAVIYLSIENVSCYRALREQLNANRELEQENEDLLRLMEQIMIDRTRTIRILRNRSYHNVN